METKSLHPSEVRKSKNLSADKAEIEQFFTEKIIAIQAENEKRQTFYNISSDIEKTRALLCDEIAKYERKYNSFKKVRTGCTLLYACRVLLGSDRLLLQEPPFLFQLLAQLVFLLAAL